MPETTPPAAGPNTCFLEVDGAGLPELDVLFVPSTAPPTTSESGVVSSRGYWNGKRAWDRTDGKATRSPSLSYSNTYRSWRICRLDGHLAYHITCDDELPPTDRDWDTYKMSVAPSPRITVHHCDPRLPCPAPNVVFVLGGPGAGKGTMCELAESQLGWTHLSTGTLLRTAREAGGPAAGVIEECIAAGQLVPNEIADSPYQVGLPEHNGPYPTLRGHQWYLQRGLFAAWLTALVTATAPVAQMCYSSSHDEGTDASASRWFGERYPSQGHGRAHAA